MAQLSLPPAPPLSSTCTLYQGDCLEIIPTLLPHSVQMSFADLPYGVTKNKWDVTLCIDEIWLQLRAVCAKNSVQVFTATQPFATSLVQANQKDFKYDIIWDKQLPSGFLNANRMPLRRHEHILIFNLGKGFYTPQKTQGQPYTHKRGTGSGRNYGTLNSHLPYTSDGLRHPVSIQRFPVPRKGNLHPTQKPIALIEWLVATYTNPGDTVLDPVFGSGTTAIACARLGRNFVGIEKDKTYFDVARARIDAERASLGLDPSS